MAAIYHFKLSRAILVGFRRQLKADGICKYGCFGMMEAEPTVPLLHVGLCDHILDVEIDGGTVYRDDLTGQVLESKLFRAARQKELDFFESKDVWSLKAFEEALRRTGKRLVTVRWVDVNKGDDINPNIRSRLVARQILQPGQEAICSPTPPLESLRTILSLAATDITGRRRHVRDACSEQRTQISAIYIYRAYFNASMEEGSEPTQANFAPLWAK